MAAKNQNSQGCLWMFSAAVIGIIAFSLLRGFLGIPDIVALLISTIIGAAIAILWTGLPKIKAILRIVVAIVFLLFIARFVTTAIKKGLTSTPPVVGLSEGVHTKMIFENNDSILVYESNRIWKDYYGEPFSAKIQVRDTDFKRLYRHVNNYYTTNETNFWGELYKYIAKKDGPALDLLVDEFKRISTQKKLNQSEFANMVVSCIQDIPYSLVFEDECLPAHNYEDAIRQVLEDCPECCIGNVAYGIQNPVSFLQNLKGDCDTRTVIIYSILKSFDFDVAILNSDFYRHSIIGINIPGKGTHKKYNGKKYLLWETTAKYFEAGNMAGTFDNVAYWDVILTSK